MSKPQLKFGLKGQTVMIVFENGKESDIYESKKEILGALPGMVTKKRLTAEDSVDILTKVMESTELPDDTRSGKQSGIGIGFIDLSNITERIHSEDIFAEELKANSKDTRPMFRACRCGTHGMFLWNIEGDSYSVSCSVRTQTEALEVLKGYQEKNSVSKEDEARMTSEIESSGLPVSKKEKVKEEEPASVG